MWNRGLFAFWFCCIGAVSHPWPMYCHDSQHTGRSGSSPSRLLPQVLWRYQASNPVYGTGVVSQGQLVVLSTFPGPLLALDAWTGEQKWNITGAFHMALGDDGNIYASDDKPSFFCASLSDGKKLWEFFPTDDPGFKNSYTQIGPDGTLYFGSHNGRVYAIHASGALKWSMTTPAPIRDSPVISADGQVLVFGSNDTFIYAVSAPDGQLLWKFRTGAAAWNTPAMGLDDVVYVPSLDGVFYAIYRNGTLKWSHANDITYTTPAIAQDGVVFAGGQNLYAFGTISGSLKWKVPLASTTPAIGADGTLFVGSFGANCSFAVDSSTGEVLWTFKFDSPAAGMIIGSRGALYVGAGSTFYALI